MLLKLAQLLAEYKCKTFDTGTRACHNWVFFAICLLRWESTAAVQGCTRCAEHPNDNWDREPLTLWYVSRIFFSRYLETTRASIFKILSILIEDDLQWNQKVLEGFLAGRNVERLRTVAIDVGKRSYARVDILCQFCLVYGRIQDTAIKGSSTLGNNEYERFFDRRVFVSTVTRTDSKRPSSCQ